ncbi:MAG: heavy-metal-associated domain-containing protein, partial [Sphingopyxis sp.]
MISAAFPRFAPRLNLDAFRPRDWRWAALFGLFFAILLVGVVEGQISRGDRGITPINSSGDFLASGIMVDVTGDNADDARTKGWREAQRLGWTQ